MISAAFENQSGTAVIHRAVLALLEPMDFIDFIDALDTTVAPILRLETLRLVMEAAIENEPAAEAGLVMVPPGRIATMIAAGRKAPRGDDIILRRATNETAAAHGHAVASEALLPLDLGPGRMPALLLLGSS